MDGVWRAGLSTPVACQSDAATEDSLQWSMLTRRAFALMPLVLTAQGKPGVIWVWFEGEDLPPGVRGEAVVFPRCYAADARPDQARRSAQTGKFAHAWNDGDPT